MNANELKKNIGKRIAKARKANGLTVKQLSEQTGFGATRISNWEQGTRCPGPMEAKSLSKILNVSGAWLLCMTNNQSGEHCDCISNINVQSNVN